MLHEGEAKLRQLVYNNAEIIYNSGDDFRINFMEQGMRCAVFDLEGNIIEGLNEPLFYLYVPFLEGEMQIYENHGRTHIIYDRLVNGKYWVRGILVLEEIMENLQSMTEIMITLLPLYCIASVVGNFVILKRSLSPINDIANTTKEIHEGTDLTARINLTTGAKELYDLADTVDDMFDRLEISFELEKQFVQNVSHELRTPLTVILAEAEFATSDKLGVEDKNESLEVIHRQATKMTNLITLLLTFTKIDSGICALNLVPTDVSELLEEICDVQRKIAPPNIMFRCSIEPYITLNVDGNMIIAMATNLINNAFKYGEDYVKVELKTENDNVVLYVKDNGMGIAQEDISKIWRRFYQVDKSRSASSSMGLGLSLVLEIAKLHEATVDVESEIGEGSTFKVIFKNMKSE